MSKTYNENETSIFDIDKHFNESLANSINMEIPGMQINNSIKSINKEEINFLGKLESENKNIRERNISLLEQFQHLQTEKAVLELTNKKNEEKVNILLQENSRLKSAMENYEQMKMRINIYEKIDFQNILSQSNNEHQIINGFSDKLKNIESDYANEIIELKKIISQLRLQIDHLYMENHQLKNSSNNINYSVKEEEIINLKNLITIADSEINNKNNEIMKLNITLEEQKQQIVNLINENKTLKSEKKTLSNTSLISVNNNNNNNNNPNDFISKKIFDELKSRYNKIQIQNFTLQEEVENEKTKYVSLLQMNQDLGKKIIENLKVISENKSEITYLKKKVAENQKDKGDIFSTAEFDDLSSNIELNLFKEEKKKANEIRLNLEKLNQEQKINIAELEQKVKEFEVKIQSLSEELNLEKMENENLKEIQKSDLKNISKILSEQTSQNQIKKNEEHINELKISLQNTNKINQELANQKTNLEKELLDLKNKIKEQQSSFLFLNNERDPNYINAFKDDRSQAAFSRYSMASNMTQNKFFDSKIKDLEESLIQEKENAENLLKIKQSILDKLKKSNENLLAERNKLTKELSEEKMKCNTLQLEKNSLLENEEYLKSQIQELYAEVSDLKLNQENYELLEEKLEEFQKQFSNLASTYNNPQIQHEQFQKLVNENVDLNAYKTKYLQIEEEMQERNKELYLLKEKCYYLERDCNLLRNSMANNNNGFYNNNNNVNNNNNGIIEELNKKIKALEEENNELKKNIEDNKLIIFSLREKCKDVIAKEKEILRLNNLVTELSQKKKKKVTFGKEIVVEYQKADSPSDPGQQVQTLDVQEKEANKVINNYNINDLLKSQEDLYQKYQKQLETLKSYQPPALFMNVNDIAKSFENDPENTTNNIIENKNNNNKENNNGDYKSNHNQTTPRNSNLKNKNSSNNINYNYNKVQIKENQEEALLNPLGIPTINVDNSGALKSLDNLNNEFERIKNKYNLNDSHENSTNHAIKDSVQITKSKNNILDNRINAALDGALNKYNVPNHMSKSQISPMSIIDKILQENSIVLDNSSNNKNNENSTDKNYENNEQEEIKNSSVTNSVIVVNDKNQLILRNDLDNIPMTNEVELKETGKNTD